MFTGLVKEQGVLVFCAPSATSCADKASKASDMCFGIKSRLFVAESVVQGSSISCSGVCLTLTKCEENIGFFDISEETIRCTTLGDWNLGECINLESSLQVGDEMGGHVVSGHVDGIGEIISKTKELGSYGYVFAVERDLGSLIAKKGSVAVDGISLTVNEVTDKTYQTHFQVNIISHTYEVTTISLKEKGSRCNIEIDTFMRYVARLKKIEGLE